jgi:thimet oligopeptidase
MSELCIQFQQNINEDKTSREFTKEELAGMPDDFIENLGKSEDGQKYVERGL